MFQRIVLPLSLPVSAWIMFLNFVTSWTNFFLPSVMCRPFDEVSRYPVSLGIALQLYHAPSQVALLVLITGAPVVMVFVLAQRWIGSGQLHGVFR